MSYTRLKSLFGPLSRRNSSASDTSRPTSPAPSLSLRPGSPAHAHSPLHNDSDAPSPSRLVSSARSTTALFTPSPERDREPTRTEENHQAPAYIPTQTIPGSESPSRADSDAPTFVTAQTAPPATPTANQPKPLPSGDQPPPPLPVQRRPTTQRRHTSAVVLSSSLPPTSSSASPIPTATPRRRRPTSLALRASSLGRYPVTNEANQTCEVTSESVSVGSYYEHVRAASDSVADRQKSVMSSVEREEERGGGVGKGTGRREWERDQEGKRGRVREGRFVDNEGRENEHGKREGSDSTTYSTQGIPEVGHVNMSGAGSGVPSGGGGGIHPPPGRSNRALSFLHNWTKRARPTLGASNSGAGSKGEATLGRRVSGLFEGVKADFDTPPPPPPAISTSSALVQYTTAGTFVHGPTTTAISTTTSRPFIPDLEFLLLQPLKPPVLIA
ncbi:hypothetical protein BDV93DRAFT_564485 [Ceratobasidium sp. AG-I]|nr:hypothetical protein BDV93DRAFT_564485 [Ceratobasidium sp. AG-I]